MLFNLLVPLADDYIFFNLFRYLTFRTGGAIMTGLLVSFIFGPALINRLKSVQKGKTPVREDVPEGHLKKVGTPTMGGFLILMAIAISTLLWADLRNGYVWIVLSVTMGFGVVGFTDDYLKLTGNNSRGLPGRIKLFFEILIAAVAVCWFMAITPAPLSDGLAIPIFKDVLVNLGWFFIPFAVFVVVGASNAVNLTDGLDGLAIVPVMIAAACFGFIAYLVGNTVYSGYLQLNYVQGVGELAVFCGALVGGSLGFLWFNAPPAMVFMGDTGSLSVGSALGTISVVTKHEVVLAIIGGLFVLETVSVIVQVISFKLTGKRVFVMAPLHHHFEKKGWAEPTIVIRFWVIASILALVGMSTLKLR
ncbi:MAG: Phospho-N-acetylmuramoyl-pentapeptide-transferase [Alphaproteobacteria bacterium MarineAlpha4_Bin2]|nr:MAG: Phospho-N-acetylmuramoyl-pentapeptide-transferase [Alphaproteobacteria bacterium MarineAlpha4_Bin2]|tara:strand:- start:161 stop:1246 length:1086 start_codon:yes stop_codon:yes gene_type:complete